MMEIVYTSDTHLDRNAWGQYRELAGDSQFAFQQIVDLALQYQCPNLVIGGDLTDVRQPPSEVVHFLGSQLERAQQGGVDTYFIQGQHELADPPWATATFRQARHLPAWNLRLPESGRIVHGIDFQYRDKLPALLAAVPADTDILVMHQVWEEFMGGVAACEGALTQIPHAPLVLTGDYHKYAYLELLGATGQRLQVYSAGATHLRRINEPDEHYVLLLDSDGEVYAQPLRSRVVARFKLGDANAFDQFNDTWAVTLAELQLLAQQRRLPPPLQKPIVEVKYREDKIENAYGRLLQLLGDDVFFFPQALLPEVEDEAAVALTVAQREDLIEQGLTGCLGELVDPADYRYAHLERLLRAAQPRLELAQLRQEYFPPVPAPETDPCD